MATHYDFFVLGAGSGGVRAARIAASLGASVGICEESRLGGTCVNIGCVPKKLYVYAAGFADAFEDAAGFGWSVDAPSFDWSTLQRNKDKEIARLNTIYGRMLENAGVTIHRGRGVLTKPGTIRVGDETITADHVLIATGGSPWTPDVPGIQHAVISDAVFELEALPERALIVGGGYIAVEFAGIFERLGVDTTVAYRSGLPLRGFDEDVRACLADELKRRGIHLRPDLHVASLQREDSGCVEVMYEDGTLQTFDLVLYATGRRPNTDGLRLEAAGIALGDRGGIVVDDQFNTNVANHYAVGDVTDGIQLTPVALAQGMALARRLFGGPELAYDPDTVPSAVFSRPSVATVGLTERQARKRGPVLIFKSHFRPMKNTLSGRQERSFMKLVVCKESDKVLGVHVVGPEAGEIVQGFAVAMTCGATKAQLDRTIGIHPTAAEELVTLRTPEEESEHA